MKQLQNIRWGSMLLFFLVLKASLIGQVRIYPSVSDGFQNRIIDYVNGLDVVGVSCHIGSQLTDPEPMMGPARISVVGRRDLRISPT